MGVMSIANKMRLCYRSDFITIRVVKEILLLFLRRTANEISVRETIEVSHLVD